MKTIKVDGKLFFLIDKYTFLTIKKYLQNALDCHPYEILALSKIKL